MNRPVMFAGIVLCCLSASEATAACGEPSVQVQDTEVYGVATAVVTFGVIPAVFVLSSSVAGLTLTNTGFFLFGGDPISAIASATAFKGGALPSNGRFSGIYSGWRVAGDQNGLQTWQVRYEATIAGNVGDIVVAGTTPPSQSTTQTLLAPPLSELLTNNTVCVGSAPTWDNQEWHQAGGALWDWKQGDGHTSPSGSIDPTKRLGDWAIIGSGSATQVQYTYTAFGGPSVFGLTVWKNTDGTYSFCDATNTQQAIGRIYEGEVSCSMGGVQL